MGFSTWGSVHYYSTASNYMWLAHKPCLLIYYGHMREVFSVHVHIPSYVERELPVKRDVVQPSQAPQTSHPTQVVLVSANEVY